MGVRYEHRVATVSHMMHSCLFTVLFLPLQEVPLTKMSADEQALCREEVKLLASIKHRNVVRYYDSFEGMSKITKAVVFFFTFLLI